MFDRNARYAAEGPFSQDCYLILFNANPQPLWVFDRLTRTFLDVNQAAIHHYGYSSDEFLHMTMLDIRPAYLAAEQHQARADFQKHGIRQHLKKNGSILFVECANRPVTFKGRPAVCSIINDVAERHHAQEAMEESERRFRAVFEQAAVGISLTDLSGKLTFVNQRFCDLIGYSQAEMLKITFHDITHPDALSQSVDLGRRLLAGEINTYSQDKRHLGKDGSIVWTHLTASLRRDQETGQPKQFIAVVEDISGRKQAEEQVGFLASNDSLTRLPNRHLLRDRLEQALSHAHRVQRLTAVLFLYVDRVKPINESLGPDLGDCVLQTMGHRLVNAVREDDTVARLGGDEFAIVLKGIQDEEKIRLVAQKILTALTQPMCLNGYELIVSVSIGISLYPKDDQSPNQLLKDAETVMRQDKSLGGSIFRFYGTAMNVRTFERLLLKNKLRHALEKQEFILHYQPRLDVQSGRVQGVEALVRW